MCNGYKDAEYVRTVLRAQQLGRHPVIVLEKLSEVHTVLHESEKLGIRPVLGCGSLPNHGSVVANDMIVKPEQDSLGVVYRGKSAVEHAA